MPEKCLLPFLPYPAKLKNKMKKMIAMFMMFAMILGLNTVAFAAGGNTVNVNTGAYDVNGVTFNAYRVFDVTKSGVNNGYVMTDKFVEFFSENKCTTDDAAYKYAKIIRKPLQRN